jgi:Flp pilus assembly protein TadG
VVEFAIVAPVFVLFVFGMIEYGRMVMVQQILTNASREGARVAVLEGASAADIEAAIIEYCEAGHVPVTADNVTIDPEDPADAAYGDPVSVTVGVAFQNVSWLPSPMYLGAAELSASSVMRKESSQ